ncbi:hypothetical protein NWE55_01050 [Myroides albus]|uniref:Uncharacterized protein n=1 Tax=Myroides albus TaxID=2562892 RepID=A0A6I3LPA4_9FLAO|nr:hypothetical protein [Myroides albus]MTG99150.1 hypothetical protein [Myroides albus]UVD79909.1 hypothetical protein NWE55_01050 [Myroides albus]
MKKYSKLNYIMKGLFAVIFFFGMIFNDVYAQEVTQETAKGTQISDDSTPNSLDPLTFSLLDLSSTERGFLMPRLTTGQRDNIPKQSLTAGLVIYNTTIGCIEFYNINRQLWMNMCGDVEPAVFTIPLDKCGQIGDNISGDYVQGMLLDERKNLISVEVNVSSPGTFEVEAIAYNTTGAENGYSFTARGVFPSSGSFLLVLKGSGTPKVGSADTNVKDTIKFFLNKKQVTCEVKNHVKPDFEPLEARFDCTTPVVAEGTYKEKVALTSANRLIVSLVVTKPGRGKIYGEILSATGKNELIQYESETIDFRVTDVNQVQTVALLPLPGTGKPLTGGTFSGKLKLVSKGKKEYDPFAEETLQTIPGCDFNINVASDGPKYSIGTIELESKFVSQIGTKNKTGGNVPYGTPYITPKTDMGPNGSLDFQAVVTIGPKAAGQYVIKSEKVNGIWFEGVGTISDDDVKEGIKTIELRAYGKSESDLPIALGRFDFTGNNLDPALSNTGTMFVDFVYRPMKMYSIGGPNLQAWHPGGRNNNVWSAGPRVVRQYKHFSWDGTVRIAGLEIIEINNFIEQGLGLDNTKDLSDAGKAGDFQSKLFRSDMIFIGGYGVPNNFKKDNQQLRILADAVKSKKIALVYGEGQEAYMNAFLNYLGDSGSASDLNNVGPFTVTSSNQLVSALIVGRPNTYFSKGEAPAGLGNLKIASHDKASTTVTNLSGTNKYVVLAGSQSSAFAFVHKTYGFVGVGSGGFMGGWFSGQPKDSYPVASKEDGTPIKRNYTGGDVYNSFFLLNLVHWAIDYAQEHQKNEVKN